MLKQRSVLGDSLRTQHVKYLWQMVHGSLSLGVSSSARQVAGLMAGAEPLPEHCSAGQRCHRACCGLAPATRCERPATSCERQRASPAKSGDGRRVRHSATCSRRAQAPALRRAGDSQALPGYVSLYLHP